MKRLDRLILGELFGPWIFGVAIFTVLIWAGSFLFQFTRLLSEGVPFPLVVQLSVLLMPGILAKTFSMAMLLGTLLAFGRLSGDSEIVALRAGGVSIGRIMVPVAIFGLLVSLLGYWMTDFVVPAASIRATGLQDELTKAAEKGKEQSTSQAIYENGKRVGVLVARDFSLKDRTLDGVEITTYDSNGKPETMFVVDRLVFDSLEKWRVYGEAKVYVLNTGLVLNAEEGLWPDQVVQPDMTPQDLMARRLKDLDALSSREIKSQINKMQAEEKPDERQISNLEFGFWNKFAVPFAAFIFGLVGAPLGIRNHRAGTATGFWLSVVIIFGYMLVTNALSIMSQEGGLPAWIASIGPLAVGGIVAMELIRRKNKQ
ncbi:LptF/LptG family permease [Kamptonema cortianum]|nr:LptF/LptG family permease [Geitlerinema splendidum]MDK3156995.1 LptF/LptG family permease [Kamptonema cortianum]